MYYCHGCMSDFRVVPGRLLSWLTLLSATVLPLCLDSVFWLSPDCIHLTGLFYMFCMPDLMLPSLQLLFSPFFCQISSWVADWCLFLLLLPACCLCKSALLYWIWMRNNSVSMHEHYWMIITWICGQALRSDLCTGFLFGFVPPSHLMFCSGKSDSHCRGSVGLQHLLNSPASICYLICSSAGHCSLFSSPELSFSLESGFQTCRVSSVSCANTHQSWSAEPLSSHPHSLLHNLQ